MASDDVSDACDVLAGVHAASLGVDGYVSGRRDVAGARTFFTIAIAAHGEPDEVVTDRAAALANVIAELVPRALQGAVSSESARCPVW